MVGRIHALILLSAEAASAKVPSRSAPKAFELPTGRTARYPARTDGRTEPEIMRDMLARHGIEPAAEHFAHMPEALEAATSSKAPSLRERGYELPGARDALAAFQAMPGVIQSVLSGNTRQNAFTKLSTFGLHGYLDFEVGGYCLISGTHGQSWTL
jgi:phosphoglycolate phosphatase